MAEPLSPSVGSWDHEEEKEFLRRLGSRLEADLVDRQSGADEDPVLEITRQLIANEIYADGTSVAVEDAVYEVAREVVTDEGAAVAFGDDIVNAGFFQDFFWGGDQEWLISVGSDRGLGFSDGIMVLDFGSAKVFAARAPNEDGGRHDWLVLAAVERGDTEALRSVVCGYVGQGWLPERVSVAGFVPRSDVEAAFTKSLDAGHPNGWTELVAVLADLAPGTDFSIDSAEQRAECLSAYLDMALSA